MLRRVVSGPLGARYEVSLQVDGRQSPVRVGSQTQNDFRADWGLKGGPKKLAEFLAIFRSSPESCRPHDWVRQSLHHFLFAGNLFDAPFATVPTPAHILIMGTSDELPLLANVPWELADGVAQLAAETRVPPLFGTLASFPLARVRKNTTSHVTHIENERLRIVYCISQPAGLRPIDAPRFQQAIEQTLRERSGMLDYTPVTGRNFTPRFRELEAALTNPAAHMLVLVCHGQTAKAQPQLHFETWIPVNDLAACIQRTHKTFLVLLIACDQVFLDEGPSATSGALTLVQNGVPAVVAMQSSVRADLAAEFLGSTLDHYFQTSSIAHAVAEGRREMAPGVAAETILDWSFPALFLTEDAPAVMAHLGSSLKFIPGLEAMMRSIPASVSYFPRPQFDGPLADYLTPTVAGLRLIAGGSGMGKTTLARHVSREAISQAIHQANARFRPILYLDFQRYPDPVVNAQDLLVLLRDRTEELKPFSGATLLPNLWPVIRGVDGAGQSRNLARQLVEIIDSNNMVLILDHIPDPRTPFWSEMVDRLQALSKSAAILIVESLEGWDGLAQNVLRVGPLNADETARYINVLYPQSASRTKEWFDQSGGIPMLLQTIATSTRELPVAPSLPQSDDLQKEPLLKLASTLLADLSASDRIVLSQLAHLPNGINSELAWTYVDRWSDINVPTFVDRGLIASDYRSSVRWLRVPGLLTRVLLELGEAEAAESQRLLTDKFVDRISDDDPERSLILLAQKPGGLAFLHDIHRLLNTADHRDQFLGLPLLLNEWLFRHARWMDAFRLWKRVLTAIPLDETEASQWVLLAKAAHVLGLSPEANQYLDEAESRSPDEMTAIDILLQRAAIIKDSGARERAAEITEMYDRALDRISKAILTSDAPTARTFREKQAVAQYNRALHRRYWIGEIDAAITDLKQAAQEFEALGNKLMAALSDCEWAEVQLALNDRPKDWNQILERLVKADAIFATEEAAGDRAFCNYQLARYYRRKPAQNAVETRANLGKAQEAYSIALKQAQIAGDGRIENIAEGHLVEVLWQKLNEISSEEANLRLERVIQQLRTFEGDAWASRVLRDMLLLRSRSAKENQLELLEEAWQVSIHKPLNPKAGTDAKRAANVLYEFLRALTNANELLRLDRLAISSGTLPETWLGHAIDLTKPGTWIEEIGAFGREAGGLNG